MRMHNQMVVAIAVVFATVVVVATSYASTRTAMDRYDQLASRPPLQNLTIATTTTDTTEGPSITAPPPRPEQATAGTDRPGTPGTPETTSQDVPDCDLDLLDDADKSNHGRLVSACIAQLREAGDFDGPPGAVIRDIARPDIENDGPPRSEQAEENNSSGDKSEDRATPPGQAKDKPNKDKD
ncbi:MAG: hypothetical protein U9R47_06870 [Actinomycetota bacterium]|nr:hypothetical protein [Actinomycetota bacterium]